MKGTISYRRVAIGLLSLFCFTVTITAVVVVATVRGSKL